MSVSCLTTKLESSWGLTEEEIKDVKLILDIALVNDSTKNAISMPIVMKYMDFSAFDKFNEQINNLYNAL